MLVSVNHIASVAIHVPLVIISATLEVRQRVSMICEWDEFGALLALATTSLFASLIALPGAPLVGTVAEVFVRDRDKRLPAMGGCAFHGSIHVIDGVLLPAKSSAEPLSAVGLIKLAISRGVPLFNDGHPAACAAVYEITCQALRVMPSVTPASREILTTALTESQCRLGGKNLQSSIHYPQSSISSSSLPFPLALSPSATILHTCPDVPVFSCLAL
jgi:hypothetical protein